MGTKIAQEIMEETKEIISRGDFQRRHVVDPEKDFIRTRKLDFATTMLYVLGNTRESMELASETFREIAEIEDISPAALCKARAKIDFSAFRAVFEASAKLMPIRETDHGYQIIAVDGMMGEMPNLNALQEAYPVHKAKKYPQFHAMAAYDVLNDIFLAADFLPGPANERQMAIELLSWATLQGDKKIFLFDRGFPSVALIQKLNTMGHKFVMRVSNSFLKEVNEFAKSRFLDKTISISYHPRRGAVNRVTAELPYEFTLRCVRIHLIDGSEEICITNLPYESFSVQEIKRLYGLRWGIEISYNYLKNAIFIEEFTSRKENGIKQDFYASLWAANLINAVIEDAMPQTIKKENGATK